MRIKSKNGVLGAGISISAPILTSVIEEPVIDEVEGVEEVVEEEDEEEDLSPDGGVG